MAAKNIKEADLYPALKTFLEAQGYEVKSEIGEVDVFAMRDEEAPVIIELKTGFSLTLFHQAIDRQSISDSIYIAVPHGRGKVFQKSLRNNKALCRRLGLGLLTVEIKSGLVTPHADPNPYRPRKNTRKKARLLAEFSKRHGDPNSGGVARRRGEPVITAYRQSAMKCAAFLNENGPTKAALVAGETGVDIARRIMADNHYGWFERVARGVYGLTHEGGKAFKAR